MARSKIPNPLDRRLVVERPLAEVQALRIAEDYLAEGRVIEALDFLEKAGASEQLTALRQQAVESGDAFLLRMVSSAMRSEPDMKEWEALAEAAAAAGLDRYAADARRQAKREED